MNQKTSETEPVASQARVSATRVRAASAGGREGRDRRGGGPLSTPTPIPSSSLAALSVHNHPLVRRHYRVATFAIESFVDLVEHCIRVLIPGALIHARPRMGKTHAIDYVALHLARQRPDILVLRMSCEHHRNDFEGPFFSTLLGAAGVREPQGKTIADKRFALIRRLSEQLQMRTGHIVVLLCDEAQRMSRHALEWLRDVHDQLAHHGFRLLTFLVGQPHLMEHKARYQLAGDEQIVARFMIEQLHFRGITNAAEAATCLASYDLSRYPEVTGDTFTAFFYPLAYGAGLRLEHSAGALWNGFVHAHAAAQLHGMAEIPMDYFTRAVESMLINGVQWDATSLELGPVHWERAVRESGYVAAQRTVPAAGVAMVLPILVLPTATPEVVHTSLITQARWVRASNVRPRRPVSGAARSAPVPAQSMKSDRAELVYQWRRVARLPRQRPVAGTSQGLTPMPQDTALLAFAQLGTQELLGDCERLMRRLLHRSRARLSQTHRRAVTRATSRFNLHCPTIKVLPAHADAAAWLLAAMHWCGCRHPAALNCKPLHPPTGIVRWLSGFELDQQVDCPREVISKLPESMALVERRSRELVAVMIRRRGVVALLPELLR